jgi:hypothetical protein
MTINRSGRHASLLWKTIMAACIGLASTTEARPTTEVEQDVFLKKHEGDYVGVPWSASVALLSARPGDTDRTQDPASVDVRELERRTRQMVDARAQEEALLHVDAHLSIRQIGNVWQIALKFEGAPTYGSLRNVSFKFEEGTVPGQIVPAQSSTYGASTVGADGRPAAIALGTTSIDGSGDFHSIQVLLRSTDQGLEANVWLVDMKGLRSTGWSILFRKK